MQSALWTKRSQDVLRCADQQPAQICVTAFGDAQLRIVPSTLVASRTQPDVGSHVAHIFKTLWIFNLQNKIERSERSYSRDLLQPKRLRIFCSGQNIDLMLEHFNAHAQLGQRLHAWA